MEFLLNYGFIALAFFVIAFIVFMSIRITKKLDAAAVKDRVVDINLELMEQGLDHEQIIDFWNDCMTEARILHQLPSCRCEDVNQCETWCSAKALFSKIHYRV